MSEQGKGTSERSASSAQASGRPGFGPRPGGGGPFGMMVGKKSRAKNVKGTIRRVWAYLRQDMLRLMLVAVLVLLGSGVNIAGPVIMGKGIDAMAVPLMDGSGLSGVDFPRLLRLVLILAGTYIAGSLAAWGQIWLMVQVSQNAVRNLRRDLFARIQQLPLRYFDATPHGELMSRLTNDVENLNNVLTNNATQLISSGAMLLGTFAVMLYYSPVLTFFTLLTVPVGLFLTNRIAKHTRKYFSEQQKELGELNGYIEETLSGMRVIKAYSMERRTGVHFRDVNRRLNRAGIKAQIYSGVIAPLMNAVNNLSFGIVAVAGGVLVLQNAITVGLVATFTGFFPTVLPTHLRACQSIQSDSICHRGCRTRVRGDGRNPGVRGGACAGPFLREAGETGFLRKYQGRSGISECVLCLCAGCARAQAYSFESGAGAYHRIGGSNRFGQDHGGQSADSLL